VVTWKWTLIRPQSKNLLPIPDLGSNLWLTAIDIIKKLTPWSSVLLQKLTVTYLVKNSPHFTECKVNRRVHKSPPLVRTMTQMNPAHKSPSYFSKIRFNIILSTSRSSDLFFPSRFPDQNFVCISQLRLLLIHVTAYTNWFSQPVNWIKLRITYLKPGQTMYELASEGKDKVVPVLN
jgi:hypothetical protein